MSVKDAKIKLDKRQAKAIALTIFADIDAYIQAHPEAYQAFLKEEMEAQQNEKSAWPCSKDSRPALSSCTLEQTSMKKSSASRMDQYIKRYHCLKGKNKGQGHHQKEKSPWKHKVFKDWKWCARRDLNPHVRNGH